MTNDRVGDAAEEKARVVAFTVDQRDGGMPGYRLENPFGQSVQVLPRAPTFRASVSFEWEGGMPEEIAELMERARATGIVTDRRTER
ncbi:MAG: hypothetical protein ABW184_16100 [Sphingobium sp.]